MEFKNNQVKILANSKTGREIYVDLQDVVLYPNTDKEVTLGNKLSILEDQDKRQNKKIAKLEKTVKGLVGVAAKLNLK